MGVFGSLPGVSTLADSPSYGLIATAPPLPAPGRSFLDTLAFMQVYGNALDTFFFHSWPEEINEGLTTQWTPIPFSGASAPLGYLYQGNAWDPYTVNLQLHSSNPVLTQKLRGPDAANIGLGIIDLLRIQLQVAWCKSICLPNNDRIEKAAKRLRTDVGGAKSFGDALSIALAGTKETASLAIDMLTSIKDDGIYSGGVFPPLIGTHYGAFLSLYGVCSSLQIRWLPPFMPLIAYPQRAEVSLTFQRFFPEALPNRTRARQLLGEMI